MDTDFQSKPIRFLYFEIARLRTLYDSKPEIREAIIDRYGRVVKELDGRGAKWFWAPHPIDQFIDIKKAFIKPNKPAWRIFTPEEVFDISGFELPVLVDIKIDGMRLQVHNDAGVQIYSEDEGLNKTSKFKEPLEDIKKLPEGTILDTEGVLVVDGQVLHRTSFIGYVNGKGFDVEKDKQTEFWVFDILRWGNKDLTDEPLSVRLSYLKKMPECKHLKVFKVGDEAFICKTREEVLSAIKKVAGKKGSEGAMIKLLSSLYVKDIHNKGWCITGGSTILTEMGFQEVKDLKVGDKIFSQDGRLHRILGLSRRLLSSSESLYDVKGKGGFKVRLTGEHPIRTNSGWKPVSTIDSSLELSKVIPETPKETMSDYLTLEFLGYKKAIKADNAFWRFIGFWVAEGSLGHGSIQQYVNVFQKDHEALLKYETILRSNLGVEPIYYQNGMRLEFRDPGLVQWLRKHFLDMNQDKTLPWFIAGLDRDKFEAFLSGYLEGDGSYDGRRWRCSSSDAGLAGRLYMILLNRGFNIAIEKHKPRKGKGYYVITEKHSSWSRPSSITYLGFQSDCLIYDIEVEREESFISPGLIMHNCKFKNLKEVDCLVVEIESPKHQKGPLEGKPVEGVFNYHVAAGPYPEADGKVLLDKVPTKVREHEGKVYAHLGKTFNTEIKVKVGDIIRVWSPEINKYEVKGTDLFTYGIYEPKVLEWVHERNIPDSLNVLNRLAEETSELHPREVVKQDQEWLVKDGDWITVNGKHVFIGEGEDFELSLHGPKLSISREANMRSYSLEGGKGKADVDIYDKDLAVIDIVEVPEKERGKGYGRYMVNRIESDLRESGVKTVHVSAVSSAIPFWDKLGYKPYLEKPDVSGLSSQSAEAKLEVWAGRRGKDLKSLGKGIEKKESDSMYLPRRSCMLIWSGLKTLIVKEKHFEGMLKKKMNLCDDNYKYGDIILTRMFEMSREEVDRGRKRSRLTDLDMEDWKGARTFYGYDFEFEPLEEPQEVKVPHGAQTFFNIEKAEGPTLSEYEGLAKPGEPLPDKYYKFHPDVKDPKFVLQRHYPTGKKVPIKPGEEVPQMHKSFVVEYDEKHPEALTSLMSDLIDQYEELDEKERDKIEKSRFGILFEGLIVKIRDHLDLRMEISDSRLVGVTIHPPVPGGITAWDAFKSRIDTEEKTQVTPKYEHPHPWLTREGELRFPTRHAGPGKEPQQAHFLEIARMQILDKGQVKYGVQRCMLPNTEVIVETPKGRKKCYIRSLVERKLPYKVLTPTGFKKILDYISIPAETVLRLKLRNGAAISVDPEHPSLRLNKIEKILEKVPTKFIKKGDLIPVFDKGYDGKGGSFEAGRFIGLWLAEGSEWNLKRNQQVDFALHIQEEELSSFIKTYAEQFGALSLDKPIKDNGRLISLSNAGALSGLIKQFVKKDKRLRNEVYGLSKEFRKGLIQGMLEGDGHVYPSSKVIGQGLNHRGLVKDLHQLIVSVGQVPSMHIFKNSIGIGYDLCNRTKGKWHLYDYGLDVKFVEVEKIEENKQVNKSVHKLYDVELEEDHRIVLANGLVTSNSDLHEFFFYGKILKGRWVIRKLKIGTEAAHWAWLLMKPSDQRPLDPVLHRDKGTIKIERVSEPSTEERAHIEEETQAARAERGQEI